MNHCLFQMVIQTQEKLLKDCYNIVLSFLRERKLGKRIIWVFSNRRFLGASKMAGVRSLWLLGKNKDSNGFNNNESINSLFVKLIYRINLKLTNIKMYLSLLMICVLCGEIASHTTKYYFDQWKWILRMDVLLLR